MWQLINGDSIKNNQKPVDFGGVRAQENQCPINKMISENDFVQL